MFRRLTARATVLASVVLSLVAASGCTDSTLPTGAELDGFGDSSFRAGSTGRPGKGNRATHIEIAPDAITIQLGQSADLSATLRAHNGQEVAGDVTWSSSDPSVASVDGGSVRGLKAGIALVIARSDRLTDTATATVTETAVAVDSVVVSPEAANLVVGQSLALDAQAVDTAGAELPGRTVVWQSSAPAIASVASDGRVTGVAPGNATIEATADGETSSVPVVVAPEPPVPVATVTVAPSPASVKEDATVQLSATLRDGDGTVLSDRSITWATSNDKVAKVSASGLVTGVGAGTATITAAAEGKSGTSAVTVTASTVAVASVSMSQSSATLETGATVQLVATPKDASGQPLTGRTIVWASTSPAVATVTSAGLVKGVAAGSSAITATVEGKVGTTQVTVNALPSPEPSPEPAPSPTPSPTPTERVGYYVSPSGSSGGSGTKSSPWSLSSVLGGSKPVAPGDTVWVLGGTYRGQFTSNLNGTSSRQIVIRQYPGERATVDGSILLFGSYVTLWGLEIMHSNPLSSGTYGVNVKAPGARLVNLVVHDAGRSGLGVWNEAPNAVVHGSLIYNNGTVDNKDHGIYFNGNTGTKYISDNIVFNNWQYGLHAYSPIEGELQNLRLDGNISFNNGSIGPYGRGPDIYVGGSTIDGLWVTNNMTWSHDDDEFALRLTGGSGLTLTGNRLVGITSLGSWSGLTQSGNTLLSSASPPSSGVNVVVRRNAYEEGRANIVVYNWSRLGSVSADLSSVLDAGDTYEIRNAQDFFGTPAVRGTYGGGSVSLPMTPVSAPRPIGRSANTPTSTGDVFHVFVVIKTN
jgi:uncharacterized protein YjdB